MTTVILKPTDGCNARCRYCSAAHPGAARTMGAQTLEQVFRLFGDWALDHDGDLNFIWHGGEPLLMPEAFWEAVFRGQETHLAARGVRVRNGIQTNATLVRESTLPFLKRLLGEHGVLGTSVDPLPGIRELKGAPDGAYARALDGATALLSDAGIRFGLLYVVHRFSLGTLGATYRGLRARFPGAGLRFNPLYRQGRAGRDAVWEDLGITAESWGEALLELHAAWTEDGRPAQVQPFGPWQRLLDLGEWRLSCECSGNCAGSHFGVDPGGRIHLCGRSADGAVLAFGEAGSLSAADLREHPIHRLVANRRAYLKRTACRGCPWWDLCHGGCVNDGILGAGTVFAPTSFCGGLRTFFRSAFGERGAA